MDTSTLAEHAYTGLAYGHAWRSDVLLPLFHSAVSGAHCDLLVTRSTKPAPLRPQGLATGRLRFYEDGLRMLDDSGAVLDLLGTDRIVLTGPPDLPGVPDAFYGTMTAAWLTHLGELVLHGSAVEVDGRAILICGDSGAGKSSLCAALVAAGARLLSDDVSAVTAGDDGAAVLYAGRSAIRLYPETARLLADEVECTVQDVTGHRKQLVWPPHADPMRSFPLTHVVLLGDGDAAPTTEHALAQHWFRRMAFRHLPQLARRAELTRLIGRNATLHRLQAVPRLSAAEFRALGRDVLRRCANDVRATA